MRHGDKNNDIYNDKYSEVLATTPSYTSSGRVVDISGPVIRARLGHVRIGELVRVQRSTNNFQIEELAAEVVGFSGDYALLTPYGDVIGLTPGAKVSGTGKPPSLVLGAEILGTVVNALGKPLHGTPHVSRNKSSDLKTLPKLIGALDSPPPPCVTRAPIREQCETGIRILDNFVPLGRGQRMCIFAEPGVGKTTLLSIIARQCSADVTVIGLIGERGREVQELLFHTLEPETLSRCVVVVSTSDEPAICRLRAAYTATRIAEYFRDNGKHVLLQIDSCTRLFRAAREVGLASGEIPVRRGYPPSVFAMLPKLIERSGTSERGSITALYTVLLSSDMDEDPMVDEIKGLTDGHISLRRELAESGQYPAIDVLGSLSRLQEQLLPREVLMATRKARKLLQRLRSDKDAILFGGRPDPELELALSLEPYMKNFFAQDPLVRIPLKESQEELVQMMKLVDVPESKREENTFM